MYASCLLKLRLFVTEFALVLRRGVMPILLGVFFVLPGVAAWGSEADRGYGPCQEDSALCRSMAIEVARAELADYLDQDFVVSQPQSDLCPEGNPECCPAGKHHECAQGQRRTVAELRRRLRADLTSRYDCPWTEDVCEEFGPFYCEPGERWTPWGCQLEMFAVVDTTDHTAPRQIPTRQLCDCDEKFNEEKGICVPKRCYPFGPDGACPLTLECRDVDQHTSAVNWPDTPLARHVRNREVQLEAARRLRSELTAKLESLEAQIVRLSKE